MKSNWLIGGEVTKTRDLLNKFVYKNETELARIAKINLNFSYIKNPDLKNIATAKLALKIISGAEPSITVGKKRNTANKFKGVNPVGSSITLKKSKMKNFLSYLKIEVLPRSKNIIKIGTIKNNKTFSFTLKKENLICFEDIEQNILLFKNLPALNITFTFDKTVNIQERRVVIADFF